MALKKIKVDTLADGRVSVWYDDDLEEYQVRFRGQGIGSTYHTTDRKDALATAQVMCNSLSLEDAE